MPDERHPPRGRGRIDARGDGRPEGDGQPDGDAQPDGGGQPDGDGQPDGGGQPDGDGQPDGSNGAGRAGATEPSIAAFRIATGTLVEQVERYVRDGVVAPEIAAAIAEPLIDEVLRSVHEPVLRLSLVGRHGGEVEPIGGWVGPTFTVLSLRALPNVGHDRAEPTDPHADAEDVVPVATEHLPLHLAVLLDLAPRQRNHGVEQPLQMPAGTLTQLLEGDGSAPLPPGLPEAWRRVLASWAESPPRTMTLTVGQPNDPARPAGQPDGTTRTASQPDATARPAGQPDDATRTASQPDGAARTASEPNEHPESAGRAEGLTTTVRWRSFSVIDDPTHGFWLVDDEVPAPRSRTSVMLSPTTSTALLDLLAAALRPHH